MQRRSQSLSGALVLAAVAVSIATAISSGALAQQLHYTGYWEDPVNPSQPGCEMWLTPTATGFDAIYKCAGGGNNQDYPTTWVIDSVVGDTTYLSGATGCGYWATGWLTLTHHHVDYHGGNGDGVIEGDGTNTPVPTVSIDSFGANPTAITVGGSSTLSWTTSNASSVSIDQGIGNVADDSSQSVSPTTTTTYTITAEGTGGPVTQTVLIVVNQPASVAINSFTASPTSVTPGQAATLSWSTSSATSVAIDQGINGVDLNGSTSVTPGSTTTYTITAQGNNGPVTAQVTVTVLVDSDTDGLPDFWETLYGLDPNDTDSDDNSIEDDDDDLDGDGVTNYAEYLLGADPTDPNSPGTSSGSLGVSCVTRPYGTPSPAAGAALLVTSALGLLLLRRRRMLASRQS